MQTRLCPIHPRLSLILLVIPALLLCSLLLGCPKYHMFSQAQPIRISFEALVVENPERIEAFPCRGLFKKGTSEGHPASDYSDTASRHPIVLTGKLKKWAELQKELVICGLSDSLASGEGPVSSTQEMLVRIPLLDMRKPLKIRQMEDGIFELEGMPKGLPETIEANLENGESLVVLWFDRNRQLTMVRLTLKNSNA